MQCINVATVPFTSGSSKFLEGVVRKRTKDKNEMLFSLHSVLFCFVAKLTTSLDDLIWLSPFLAKATRPQRLVYSQICK